MATVKIIIFDMLGNQSTQGISQSDTYPHHSSILPLSLHMDPKEKFI